MPNYTPYEYDTDTALPAPARHVAPIDPTETRRYNGYLWCLTVGLLLLIAIALVLFIGGRRIFFSNEPRPSEPNAPTVGQPNHNDRGDRPYADGKEGNVLLPRAEDAVEISAVGLDAANIVLADLTAGTVTATYRADASIYPASMTKVMTLIVAVENLPSRESLQDTVTISKEVYDEMVRQGSSGIGFDVGERLTVEALLYALILESDGIAACELARYIAGSESAFVALMNRKAADMGLQNTHFENATGLHHADHRSTVREIASIMAYAMDMALCRRVMTAETYNAIATQESGRSFTYYFKHGLLVKNFESNAAHQPDGLTVLAGKTGYVPESGYCLVTYAESADGKGYVCVTAGGKDYAACIRDYISVYHAYT